MKVRNILVPLAGLALLGSAGAASAHDWGYGYGTRYVTTYRPVTRYVRRTVVVRERVWRPVRHRVHYRTVYVEPYYPHHWRRGYGPRYAYADTPWWERRHAYERWEHRW